MKCILKFIFLNFDILTKKQIFFLYEVLTTLKPILCHLCSILFLWVCTSLLFPNLNPNSLTFYFLK